MPSALRPCNSPSSHCRAHAGPPHLRVPYPHQTARSWLLVAFEPPNAALLGISDDGSVHDVWRLQKQLSLVEAQGFEFFGVNGLLNLFQWWRNTDYALVPPNMIDMTPPLNINFDTNLLLQVRQSGQEAIDRRTAQHP